MEVYVHEVVGGYKVIGGRSKIIVWLKHYCTVEMQERSHRIK